MWLTLKIIVIIALSLMGAFFVAGAVTLIGKEGFLFLLDYPVVLTSIAVFLIFRFYVEYQEEKNLNFMNKNPLHQKLLIILKLIVIYIIIITFSLEFAKYIPDVSDTITIVSIIISIITLILYKKEYTKIVDKEEEKKKLNEIDEIKKEEEKINKMEGNKEEYNQIKAEEIEKKSNQLKVDKVDKIISRTNDEFDVNFEKEFSKAFAQVWVKFCLDELKINEKINDLHNNIFNEQKAKELVDCSEFILMSIHAEWYDDYYPLKDFKDIKKEAKNYAGGVADKLSTLENYLFLLTKNFTDRVKINKDVINEFGEYSAIFGGIEIHSNIINEFNRRRTVEAVRGKNSILYKKLVFLIMSVFFKDREGILIEGRSSDRVRNNENMHTISNDIEKTRSEIIENEKFYERIIELKRKNKKLEESIEIFLTKINPADEKSVEKINSFIREIEEVVQQEI